MVTIMNKGNALLLIGMVLGLVFYAIFSSMVGFHDSVEYVTVAKELAGYGKADVYYTHPLVFPYFLSLFLAIVPGLLVLKLANAIWLVLDAILLLRNDRAFLLFVFSPLVWIMGIQISPLLPVSFFMLLSYIALQKQGKKYFIISGLSLGLASAIYTPVILVSLIFMVVYLFNRPLKYLLAYTLLFLLTFSSTLILDYLLLGFPLDSMAKYFGTNIVIYLGLNRYTKPLMLTNELLLAAVLISPLLFFMYRIKRKYYKEIIFLALAILPFLSRSGLKYMIIFTPIILLLLAGCLKKRQILYSILVSLILIPVFTYSYFLPNFETVIVSDLREIKQDFHFEKAVADHALLFSSYMWDDDDPWLYWIEEYYMSLEEESVFQSYAIRSKPKINIYKVLSLEAKLERSGNEDLSNYPLILANDAVLEGKGYRLLKRYDVLSVHEKV